MRMPWLAALGLAFLVPQPVPVVAQSSASSVVREGPIDHDVYLGGSSVALRGPVDGDAVLAGGQVATDGEISGSVLAAGGTVDIRGTVKRSVRIAGGDVTAAAQVGRDLTAAGGTVTLSRDSHVTGDVWIAAAHAAVNGAIGKNLDVIGANIAISGTIEGDAHLRGRWITIGPNAVIHGHLSYESDTEASIASGAHIDGGVTRGDWETPRQAGAVMTVVGYAAKIVLAIALLAAGLLFILVFPGYSLNAARLIGLRPLASLGLGFALLIATPVAVIIAMVSMLGAILGLVVLAAYFISLLLAVLTATIYLGDAVLRLLGRGPVTGFGRRLAALILGVIALMILSGVPFVGFFVVLGVFVFGLGAFYLEAAERY
jgi:hypothetical protein